MPLLYDLHRGLAWVASTGYFLTAEDFSCSPKLLAGKASLFAFAAQSGHIFIAAKDFHFILLRRSIGVFLHNGGASLIAFPKHLSGKGLFSHSAVQLEYIFSTAELYLCPIRDF